MRVIDNPYQVNFRVWCLASTCAGYRQTDWRGIGSGSPFWWHYLHSGHMVTWFWHWPLPAHRCGAVHHTAPQDMSEQRRSNAGPTSLTLAKHWTGVGQVSFSLSDWISNACSNRGTQADQATCLWWTNISAVEQNKTHQSPLPRQNKPSPTYHANRKYSNLWDALFPYHKCDSAMSRMKILF